ncbi:MAG TPA: tRNA (adenosine(37)-N6)-dimethylallyltransferase MiaA [Acholeplasmataceae bacterium]|jgi:tRNA dimethylallyltransferase|nr:tRNA (adenosine(37)-N6)-dimethylallyltransferase MiaA [Acholeplasmataceae bacterium]
MIKVIIITGPTAVGKTKLSVEIANFLKTDIINGDAFQIYQKMDIGTAKPSPEIRAKIKHHLCDFLNPLQPYSIYDYQKDVRALISKMHQEGKVPLLVGGSGLYLDCVIYDYELEGHGRSKELEEELSHLDNEAVHAILQDMDSIAAQKIHPNNRKRVLRAIELAFEQQVNRNRKDVPLYDVLYLFLTDDREALYQSINERVEEMFSRGLLGEVEKLFPEHLGIQARKAIGYKELIPYLEGKITLEEAKEKIKQATRNYAKRQWTWFRNRQDIVQVQINRSDFSKTIEEVKTLIDQFMGV